LENNKFNEFEDEQEFKLGLNISKMIISQYNGKLFFKSKVNQGSTFGFIMDMKILENNLKMLKF